MYVCIHTHTQNGIEFSHENREIMPLATTWMDLESIMLNEISQTNTNIA